MKKTVFILGIAVLMAAACARENAPEATVALKKAYKAGETVQITATLPEVEKIDTRVSLSDNGKGGFAWRRIFCTAGGGDMPRMTNPTTIRLRCIRLSGNLLTGNLPEQVPAQKIS